MSRYLLYLILPLSLWSCENEAPSHQTYDVLVLGEGTGATAAAIQAARSGAHTLLINPQVWLGGMLTAAGVPATDGNHRLPAGIWGEFRQALRDHYGGADSLFTGWVSNTQFEPHIGARIWKNLAEKEANLEVLYEANWSGIRKADQWIVQVTEATGTTREVEGRILIDGTDLGDVAAQVGVAYKLGMDARKETGESMAPVQANKIVQDLTWCAILKDFGPDADKTIPEPPNYTPSDFYCSCAPEQVVDSIPSDLDCGGLTVHPCQTMITYAKLPNNKYMINWPLSGNDYYANLSELSEAERQEYYQKAKAHTLGFVYYIQTVLGFKHLGLAEDEFPTEDGLALMPYHREGRRIKGLVRMNVNHILDPYATPLYRTGIAVGDYPIDHHHYKNAEAPEIDFPPVPSFNIPMGCLLPMDKEDLIMADKAISVTNIVNGSSRLQPVILQIGQAAGLMAALAVKERIHPSELDVRNVQKALLEMEGYLMPFIDLEPEHPYFPAIQSVGASGILKGRGVPFQWANQTWFDLDSTISKATLAEGLSEFDPVFQLKEGGMETHLSIQEAYRIITSYLNADPSSLKQELERLWREDWELPEFQSERLITKGELAVMIHELIDPLSWQSVDIQGNYIMPKTQETK